MTDQTSSTNTVASKAYGSQLVRTWEPEGAQAGTIVIVHGLAEHSGRYERTGRQLADRGFAVVAPDLYGFGASGGDRANVKSWDDYLTQIEDLLAAGSGPKVLLGHSMGGLISLNYALSEREQPDLLVLSAPAIGGGAAWQKALAPVLARLRPGMLIPNNLDGSQLSREPEVGEAYFADPLVFTKTTAHLGSLLFAAQAASAQSLEKLSLPTLVMHGGADTVVPPWSTAALGDLPGVERRLYPKLRHEILNEPEGPELVAEIADWVEDQLSESST